MYLNGYLWGPPDANFKILNDKVRSLNILRLGSNNKYRETMSLRSCETAAWLVHEGKWILFKVV